MSAIILGKTYTDKITGFKGTATGHCRYISGCHQVLLAPKLKEDGSYQEGKWFDEQRVVLQKNKTIVLDNEETPGCDISAPVR